jgi:hypothetical protein
MMGRLPRIVYLLAMGVVPLAVWATLTGLLSPGFYAGVSASLEAQAVGQDLVTLVFALPVTFAALIFSFQGSQRGDMLLIGLLFYLVYTYLAGLVLVPFNHLWLVYLLIFSGSGAALLVALYNIDLPDLTRRFEQEIHPHRWLGWFQVVASVLVALMWLSMMIPAVIRGSLPASFVEEAGGATIIQVLDLGVLIPLGITAGVLMLRRTPMGYLLTSLVMVKVTTISLAILSMLVFMRRANVSLHPAQIVLFLLIFLIGATLLVLHLRALNMDEDD